MAPDRGMHIWVGTVLDYDATAGFPLLHGPGQESAATPVSVAIVIVIVIAVVHREGVVGGPQGILMHFLLIRYPIRIPLLDTEI